MNHVANVLVVVAVANSDGSGPTSVTVAGTAATLLTSASSSYGHQYSYLYYIFRTAAGNETVQVTYSGARNHAWVAVSFTGTKQDSPFFEGTATAGGQSSTSSVAIVAGTADRRIINQVSVGGSTGSGSIYVTPTVGAEISEQNKGGDGGGGATSELNYIDSSSAQTMTANLSTYMDWAAIVTGILPYVPITEYVNVSDSGAGTDAVTFTETEYINISESSLGTEILTVGDIENIAVSDSGIGTDEIPSVEEFIVITETGLGTDTVLVLYKGETLIGGVNLPHVQRIHVSEPTIISTKLVPGLLPTRRYLGKQGRTIEFEGWTDSLTTLEELKAFADGTAHDVWLPDGTNLSAHVINMVPQHPISPGRYPYTIHAVERMD